MDGQPNQLAAGTCRTRVRDMFGVPAPYMEYWTEGAVLP